MKYLRQCIPVIIMLVTGCATAQVQMMVDPSLEANALVYEITYPGSLRDNLSDNKLNVSFGPYRVADAHVGWQETTMSSSTGSFWTDMLFEATGISTSDSTESDDTEAEVTTSEVSQSLSYTFMVGDEITWDARCSHAAERRVTKTGNLSRLEILSSNYTCRYRGNGNESWILSVRSNDEFPQPDITLSSEEQLFSAHETKGEYVMPDGSISKFHANTAGFTWTHDESTIAAVSVREEVPRVWLDRQNSDPMNHVLAMASTGLLMYDWKIAPTLRQH